MNESQNNDNQIEQDAQLTDLEPQDEVVGGGLVSSKGALMSLGGVNTTTGGTVVSSGGTLQGN